MSETIKSYVDQIEDNLRKALASAQYLQVHVQEVERDSDLYRKVSNYLTPNLYHWLEGAQAGNINDLRETMARRLATQAESNMEQSHQGDGHSVLTKPTL